MKKNTTTSAGPYGSGWRDYVQWPDGKDRPRWKSVV